MTQKIGQADTQYKKVIDEILENGLPDDPVNVRPVYEDGEKATTVAVLNLQMKYDNSGDEALLLTSKRNPQKDPLIEIDWIWKQMSNKVQDLRDVGCTVWDEWENDEGTIGKAYGWQLANKKRKVIADDKYFEMFFNGEFSFKLEVPETMESFTGFVAEKAKEVILERVKGKEVYLNQVDYLLYHLKNNPYSRRIKTTLYCVEDLDDMALEPCVYETQWISWGGKLNLTVMVRSNDMALGNPYNIYQYAVLHKQIAQATGLVAGELCFNIVVPHLYERHIPTMLEQMKQPLHEPATIKLNPDVTSFYDFTPEDITIEGYQHGGNFYYEIAI